MLIRSILLCFLIEFFLIDRAIAAPQRTRTSLSTFFFVKIISISYFSSSEKDRNGEIVGDALKGCATGAGPGASIGTGVTF